MPSHVSQRSFRSKSRKQSALHYSVCVCVSVEEIRYVSHYVRVMLLSAYTMVEGDEMKMPRFTAEAAAYNSSKGNTVALHQFSLGGGWIRPAQFPADPGDLPVRSICSCGPCVPVVDPADIPAGIPPGFPLPPRYPTEGSLSRTIYHLGMQTCCCPSLGNPWLTPRCFNRWCHY